MQELSYVKKVRTVWVEQAQKFNHNYSKIACFDSLLRNGGKLYTSVKRTSYYSQKCNNMSLVQCVTYNNNQMLILIHWLYLSVSPLASHKWSNKEHIATLTFVQSYIN